MSLKLGDLAVSRAYLGDKTVSRMYLGDKLVYQYAFLQAGSRSSTQSISRDSWTTVNNLGAAAEGTVMSAATGIICQAAATYTLSIIDVRAGSNSTNRCRLLVNGVVVATLPAASGSPTNTLEFVRAMAVGDILSAGIYANTSGSSARQQTQCYLAMTPVE